MRRLLPRPAPIFTSGKPKQRAFCTSRKMSWHTIDVPISELCIDTTLRCGQSFRWQQSAPDATKLYYKASFPPALNRDVLEGEAEPMTPRTHSDQAEYETEQTRKFLEYYLNLEPNLTELYAAWSEKDKNFAKRAPSFHGVRILKQDSWEALAGFICSSCNNIKRITQMMRNLCQLYGPLIGHIDGVAYYDMPAPSAMVNPRVEEELRGIGFGYRAKYLYNTALMITREQEGWLDSLRNPENPIFGEEAKPAGEMLPEGREGFQTAREALVALPGVGPKVADCVCLFGLGWGEAVPIDTHVWQIAQRDYGFGKGKHKSLTAATYNAVADHFRQLWGKEAGWAHSVLFTADLKTFAERALTKVKIAEEDINAEPGSDTWTPPRAQAVKLETLTTPAKAIKGEFGSTGAEDNSSSSDSDSTESPFIKAELNETPRRTGNPQVGEVTVMKEEFIESATPTIKTERGIRLLQRSTVVTHQRPAVVVKKRGKTNSGVPIKSEDRARSSKTPAIVKEELQVDNSTTPIRREPDAMIKKEMPVKTEIIGSGRTRSLRNSILVNKELPHGIPIKTNKRKSDALVKDESMVDVKRRRSQRTQK